MFLLHCAPPLWFGLCFFLLTTMPHRFLLARAQKNGEREKEAMRKNGVTSHNNDTWLVADAHLMIHQTDLFSWEMRTAKGWKTGSAKQKKVEKVTAASDQQRDAEIWGIKGFFFSPAADANISSQSGRQQWDDVEANQNCMFLRGVGLMIWGEPLHKPVNTVNTI